MGSSIPYSVPRGTFRCSDGEWVAISSSADTVAARVMDLIGLGDDPRFADFAGRVEHRTVVDEAMTAFRAARTWAEVLAIFDEAHAAAAVRVRHG